MKQVKEKTVALTQEQFANYGAFAVVKVCQNNKQFECLVSKVGIEVTAIIATMLFANNEKSKLFNEELKGFIAEKKKREEALAKSLDVFKRVFKGGDNNGK